MTGAARRAPSGTEDTDSGRPARGDPSSAFRGTALRRTAMHDRAGSPADVTPVITTPLSVPEFGWRERAALWRATVGARADDREAMLRRFETRLSSCTDAGGAVATTSGTSALLLALRVLGVGAGDEVLVPALAPFAVVAPILWLSARPVVVDVDAKSWTLDPGLVAMRIREGVARGRPPKAVIAVDLFGQTCDFNELVPVCQQYGVPLIEDASQALGATWRHRLAGGNGTLGIVSFGANKVASMVGGGALLAQDVSLIAAARRLVGPATPDGPVEGQHSCGSRLNPMLAPVGLVQLDRLTALVAARRSVAQRYARRLGGITGLAVVPEMSWGRSSRWLSVVSIESTTYGATAHAVMRTLLRAGIESRLVWTPLHRTRALADAEYVGGTCADRLATRALCLPSGAQLDRSAQDRVIAVLRRSHRF